MTTFAGRVEARCTVPTGGAAVSVTIPNGAGASTKTVAAGNYYLTTAGGVSSLLTTLQSALNDGTGGYPQSAAAAAAVGAGSWDAAYLLNESSGNLASVFGAPATLTASGSPTYSIAGYRGGIDKAIGFAAATNYFDGGNVFDVTGTDDLVVAAAMYWTGSGTASRSIISKISAAANDGWAIQTPTSTTLRMSARVSGGGAFVESGSITVPAAGWYALLAIIDRSANVIQIGLQDLSTAVQTLSTTTAVGASTFSTAATLRLGASAWVSTAPDNMYLSYVAFAHGSGAATGIGSAFSSSLTKLANAINAAWTVSMSTTTGLVSIGWTGYTTPTWSLTWTSTDLRDVLGFTANISGVTTTQTGTQQARGLWFPDCPVNLEGDPKRAPLVSDARTSMSPTGQTITLVGNTFRRQRSIVWSHVPIAQVWDAEATYENASWEEFVSETQFGLGSSWFTPGSPIQIYDLNGIQFGVDASVAGWSIIGINSIEPQKSDPGWTGLWRIELPTLIAVGS